MTDCSHMAEFLVSYISKLVLFPGLPMFFNIHKKNLEGLVDFGDVIDMVCDDVHWNE